MAETTPLGRLAAELGLPPAAVEGAAALLEARATPPFIARYRKEAAGGLNEEQLRAVARGLRALRAIELRRSKALKALETRGKLTDAVRAQIEACCDAAELDELYLTYSGRRYTRGTLAKGRGLGPLADAILAQSPGSPPLEEMAAAYVNSERGVPDVAAALEGASHIIAEAVANAPGVKDALRQLFAETCLVRARVAEAKEGKHSKYEMYYDFSEPAATIPSHRILAIRRGESEGWLKVSVEADREKGLALLREGRVKAPGTPSGTVVETAVADAYDRLLAPGLEAAVRAELKRRADAGAIAIFARNLRSLLLQPPAGPRRTLGVHPSLRGGCRLAAVDESGKLLEHSTIFPLPPEAKIEEARAVALGLIEKHGLSAVAIGSGAGSRELDRFFRELLKTLPPGKVVQKVVNDSGASVHATSKAARDEFPDLEPAVRCAVSFARRLQDPLTELVQVDPKAIGVGQYQHDVNQGALREALEATVASCVSKVGVDLNRAPAALLAYVAGVGRGAAREIVRYRGEHGPFRSREQLKEVPHFSEKQFEQAAGFLRIYGGENPLDATGIHPERYALVARIAADAGTDVASLLGNRKLIEGIDFSRYAGPDVGEPTLADIRRELLYPAHDPRGPFRAIECHEAVASLEELKPGMVLEGTVSNVTNFGAFVDIGLREDGLVHVSHIAPRYVQDPIESVRVGDVVRVKVLSVDLERRRIALSIKDALPPPPPRKPRPAKPAPPTAPAQKTRPPAKARPTEPPKPKRDPLAPATPEDIARLIAHFQSR